MVSRDVIVFVMILSAVAIAIYGVFAAKIVQTDQFAGIAAVIIIVLAILPKIYTFKQYERAVVLRFGSYNRTVGPGLSLIFPAFEKFDVVDMRTQTIDTKPQDAQTKDDVKIKLDVVSFFRITNPKKALLEVKDLHGAILKLLQGEIRLIVGKLDLDEVIEETEQVNETLFAKLKEVEEDWGFVVLRVELESVELPPSLVEARTKAREAKEYKEKVEIEASARQISLEILDKAASKMSDKTMSYLYLDALKKISDGKSNKIIFPLELTRLATTIAEGLTKNKDDQGKKYGEILEGLKNAYNDQQKEQMDKTEKKD
ncbi:MAG: SPFH domain-containing protein [Candidatus Micrarchaeota archaeon]